MRRLPRRRLADAALHHVAHDHFLDLVGGDAGALERRRMATAPSSGAESDASPPRNLPIGVRAAATITG